MNLFISCATDYRVKTCQSSIRDEWNTHLYKVITTILQEYGHQMLQINGMPDHIHLLFGMQPTQSLSDLMKYVKQRSSSWINDERLLPGKFSWQEGYGAFSYAKSEVSAVINYIQNQQEHHKTTTFLDEYVNLLDEWDVAYDKRYVFKPIL